MIILSRSFLYCRLRKKWLVFFSWIFLDYQPTTFQIGFFKSYFSVFFSPIFPTNVSQTKTNQNLDSRQWFYLFFDKCVSRNETSFATTINSYTILAPTAVPKGFVDAKVAAEKVLSAIQLDENDFRYGHTKACLCCVNVFLSNKQNPIGPIYKIAFSYEFTLFVFHQNVSSI